MILEEALSISATLNKLNPSKYIPAAMREFKKDLWVVAYRYPEKELIGYLVMSRTHFVDAKVEDQHIKDKNDWLVLSEEDLQSY